MSKLVGMGVQYILTRVNMFSTRQLRSIKGLNFNHAHLFSSSSFVDVIASEILK